MNISLSPKLILIVALFLFSTITITSQQVSVENEWAPPPPRLESWTIFAPKPIGGNNIFKGDAEIWLAEAIEKIEGGKLTPIKDKSVSDYVSRVGENLVKYSVKLDIKYQFIVLNDSKENAMNLGGGRVYINLGMLKAVESEDELAGVLAHEIGHNAFGHIPKTVTRQLFWMKGIKKVITSAEVECALQVLDAKYRQETIALIGESLLGFSRFDELEADRAAFYNIYKAGYNPRALVAVMERFKREEKENFGKDYGINQFFNFILSSHPPSTQRSLALSWESNFVKMPPQNASYQSSAFNAMKAKLVHL